MRKPYFPMFVDISEKNIVVVGGGKIAQRRIETLLKFAGHIALISAKATETLSDLAEQGQIRWIEKDFVYRTDGETDTARLLRSADMVLAATDDREVNEQIACLCREAGVTVNVCHRRDLCDFYFPGVVVRENVVAGITASGLGHRQARRVREIIDRALE